MLRWLLLEKQKQAIQLSISSSHYRQPHSRRIPGRIDFGREAEDFRFRRRNLYVRNAHMGIASDELRGTQRVCVCVCASNANAKYVCRR